jgi:hypothetical protein
MLRGCSLKHGIVGTPVYHMSSFLITTATRQAFIWEQTNDQGSKLYVTQQISKALFGYSSIDLNPRVLRWIRVYISLNTSG